jgi:ornithine cyclodeaminase/alanine dehydrogenase-like protein (mu-crystallin family)
MEKIEAAEVFAILTMERCVGLMRETLAGLAAGKYLQPVRSMVRLPKGNLFGFMPASLGEDDYFGAKVVTGFHGNLGTGYPTHMGYVMLFEPVHGELVAMVDATSITQIRTGAVSAVATDLLARPNARSLALIGAGAQARSHLEAIKVVRDIQELRVYDISRERAFAFAKEMEGMHGRPILVSASAEEAARDADIVCTLTPGGEPFLKRAWIKTGAHVNAVGTFTPEKREVCSDLVVASKLYADQVEAMKKECGEYLIPIAEGLIDEHHIVGSIGDIILGRVPGRVGDADITLFDALGMASEDVACAKFVYTAVASAHAV